MKKRGHPSEAKERNSYCELLTSIPTSKVGTSLCNTDCNRKTQPGKTEFLEPSPNWYHAEQLFPRPRYHFRSRVETGDRKIANARGTGSFFEIVSHRNVRSSPYELLRTCFLNMALIRRTQINVLMWTGKAGSRAFNSSHKTTGNYRMLREGEIVLSREKHTSWFSNTKWSALKTYVSSVIEREQGAFTNYFYIRKYICSNINEKRGWIWK